MTENEKKCRLIVKRQFYNYKANRQKYLEKLNDIAYASGGQADRVESSNKTNFADKVGMNLDTPEYRWCLVVERTMRDYEESGKDKFIRDKFINGMKDGRLCMKYCISYQTARNWAEEIITHGVCVAIQGKLVEF